MVPRLAALRGTTSRSAALMVFFLIVVLCAIAPWYAENIAETGPNRTHLTDKVEVDGKMVDVISAGGTEQDPETGELRIKPSRCSGRSSGWAASTCSAPTRAVATSPCASSTAAQLLQIGIGSAIICTLLATVLALLAGYFGGWGDWTITRVFDLIAAAGDPARDRARDRALDQRIPRPDQRRDRNLWIPTLIISVILVAYIGRPLRGQILASARRSSSRRRSLRARARARDAGRAAPNIASTILVFFTLIIANNILVEAALSFLGAGVQPPNPSWGTLIAEGQPDPDGAVADDRARHRDRAHGRRAEHLRRRAARRTRPAGEGPHRALVMGAFIVRRTIGAFIVSPSA